MQPKQIKLPPTKLIPNSTLPLLLYKGALGSNPRADDIEAKFESHGWQPQWRFGMFSQAHFHSTTHEALGVYSGRATCRFGASDDSSDEHAGQKQEIEAGDVIVIPAGVAHQAVDSHGLQMVGAYPLSAPAKWDMCYGGEKVREDIPAPQDPLGSGQLEQAWKKAV